MPGFFFALSLLLFVSLAVVVVSRYVRMAVLWGILVGPALGFWIIAPVLLTRHHFVPDGIRQWAIVDGYLLVVFAALGGVLALLTSWPLAFFQFFPKAAFRAPSMAALAWVALWLPVDYLVLSALIEWSFFSRHAAPDFQLHVFVVAAAIAAAAAALVVTLYRRFAWARFRGRRAATLVGAALLLGVVALVFRAGPVRAAQTAALPRPVRRAGSPHAPPLLVVGLDGANWRTLRPLIDRGLAPTFARLIAQGIQGEMHAEWPPYWSTPAWGAILTGHGQDEIGVHEDAAGTAPGLPTFEFPLTLNPVLNPMFLIELGLIRAHIIEPTLAPRFELRLPPIWERLTDAGVKTAVVGFPFTYPVSNQAAYVVSNRLATDLWEMLGVEPGDRNTAVGPRDKTNELLDLFDGATVDSAEIARVGPPANWPQPADAIVDPSTVVPKVMDTSERLFGVATQLVRQDPSLDAVMVYTSDFDSIAHAFWQYRFPGDYPDNPPTAADVAALGPVIDRDLEYLDGRIGALIAAFPEPPNVIVVSDHGEEASRIVTLWRGWHGPLGIALAAGPGVAHHDGVPTVTYYDVAPTILDLLRFAPSSDMRGKSLVSATDQGRR